MDLDQLRVFVAVVEQGSLAAASKSLRFPIATLRRRLDELEAHLGVPLLERSRRGVQPTSAGAVLAREAQRLLGDLHALSELCRAEAREPSGEVALALPQGLPPDLLGTFFALALERFPRVTWRLRCVPDPVSALGRGDHAALYLGARPPDGPFKARRLLTVPERLLASPAYLQRHGTPQRVEDLRQHRLLLWDYPERGAVPVLPLRGGGLLEVTAAMRLNDILLLRRCAALGCGLALVPDAPLPPDPSAADQELVPVLPGAVGAELGAWLLAHEAIWSSPRMRQAIEQVTTLLSSLRAP